MTTKLRLVAILLCVSLTGCQTLTAWQANPKVQFAEQEAVKIALAYFSNGGNVDTAWGVANGLQVAGDIATFANSQGTPATTVAATVKAFADDPTAIRNLANNLASVVNKIHPTTPEESALISQALANGIQKATAQATP